MDIMGESDDWGFEQYVDEYTKTVVEEIEKRKSTTKQTCFFAKFLNKVQTFFSHLYMYI